MTKTKTKLFLSDLIGDQVLLPKGTLAKMVLDGSLPGASNIRTYLNETNHCRYEADRESNSAEKRDICSKTDQLHDELLSCKTQIKEAIRRGEPIEELKSKLETKQSEFHAHVKCSCKDCPYRTNVSSSRDAIRQDISRIGHKKGDAVFSRAAMVVYILLQSICGCNRLNKTELESENPKPRPTVVSLRMLVDLSGYTAGTVLAAFMFLEEQDIIVFSRCGRGQYCITFTLTEEKKPFLTAKEGGSGYIMLDRCAVEVLMNLKRIDSFRLMLLLYYSMDDAAYRRQITFSQNSKNVTVNNIRLLPFLLRRVNASLKTIIDNFHQDLRAAIVGTGTILLDAPNVYNIAEASSIARNNGIYDHYTLSMSFDIVPKQYNYTADVTNASLPDTLLPLQRRMSDNALSIIEKAEEDIFGSLAEIRSGLRGKLLPEKFGGILPYSSSYKMALNKPETKENRKKNSLLPACEFVSRFVGARFLYGAIMSTLSNFRARIIELGEDMWTPEWAELATEMNQYLIGTARKMREKVISTWRSYRFYKRDTTNLAIA